MLSQVRGHFWVFSQVGNLWAHVDLNHGPHPYQGCALTGLSYGPNDVMVGIGDYTAALRLT